MIKKLLSSIRNILIEADIRVMPYHVGKFNSTIRLGNFDKSFMAVYMDMRTFPESKIIYNCG